MRAKVAVATVSGKAYFLLVNELKERKINFASVIPGEPLPAGAKVVITTEEEKNLVENDRVLIFKPEIEPSRIIIQAARILQGREAYDKIVIGIDPGEVFGLAAIADGKVIETCNCFNSNEVVNFIKDLIKSVDVERTVIIIKVGNGVPAHKDLLGELDAELPQKAVLEVVGEAGTNRSLIAHRRGLRDIASATRIAGRVGYVYARERLDEQSSQTLF